MVARRRCRPRCASRARGWSRRGRPRRRSGRRSRPPSSASPSSRSLGEGAQHDAPGAQAVQDRRREAGALREVRVGVQRVAVAAEAVEQRLLRRHVVRRIAVGRAVGDLDRVRRTAVAAPAALAAHEDRRAHGPQPARPSAATACRLLPDDGGLALVPDVGDPGVHVAEPKVGIGPWTCIDWLPCTTCARSIVQPGRSSGGGSVSWKVGATTPKLGSTCRSSSSRV